MQRFLKIFRNNKAATAIEYGLIATFIAIAAITSLTGIGSKLKGTFNNVSNKL